MKLKERGIYQLPNGRELIARVTQEQKTVLQDLSASETRQYRLNDEGQLVLEDQLTEWEVDDLVDTGRVALPGFVNVLSDAAAVDPDTASDQLL